MKVFSNYEKESGVKLFLFLQPQRNRFQDSVSRNVHYGNNHLLLRLDRRLILGHGRETHESPVNPTTVEKRLRNRLIRSWKRKIQENHSVNPVQPSQFAPSDNRGETRYL